MNRIDNENDHSPPAPVRVCAHDWRNLEDAALCVLGTSDPASKASYSHQAADAWRAGALTTAFIRKPPQRPARPVKPEIRRPGDMPRRSKGGSLQGRIALLHAIAHIEFNAIDLAWDMVARFGKGMPKAFLDDWVEVGDDEARHFLMIEGRLAELGASYGDLPAHDGLWESAEATADNFGARLAIVPMVLEARGLDVTPSMIARLESAGDSASAKILQVIYTEEVEHVAKGKRWFDWHCENTGLESQSTFQAMVSSYFRGALKPPFNHEARLKAGLPADYYEPLVPSAN